MNRREVGQWVYITGAVSSKLIGQIVNIGNSAQNYIMEVETLDGSIYKRYSFETTVITDEEAFLAKLEYEVAEKG